MNFSIAHHGTIKKDVDEKVILSFCSILDPVNYVNVILFVFNHMQDLFDLPCSTTCDNFQPQKYLQPWYNQGIIHHAVVLYKGGPVIDSSDKARALRFV